MEGLISHEWERRERVQHDGNYLGTTNSYGLCSWVGDPNVNIADSVSQTFINVITNLKIRI